MYHSKWRIQGKNLEVVETYFIEMVEYEELEDDNGRGEATKNNW